MSDADRIKALESELANLKTQFTQLSQTVRELSTRSDSRRQSIQTAVDDLQQSIKLIFTNVNVPNVIFDPTASHTII